MGRVSFAVAKLSELVGNHPTHCKPWCFLPCKPRSSVSHSLCLMARRYSLFVWQGPRNIKNVVGSASVSMAVWFEFLHSVGRESWVSNILPWMLPAQPAQSRECLNWMNYWGGISFSLYEAKPHDHQSPLLISAQLLSLELLKFVSLVKLVHRLNRAL